MILTTSTLEKMQPRHSRYVRTCSERPGLAVKVYPSGTKALYFRQRQRGKLREEYLGEDFESALEQYEAFKAQGVPVTTEPRKPVVRRIKETLQGYPEPELLIDTSWEDLSEDWLEFVLKHRSAHTHTQYSAVLRQFREAIKGIPDNVTCHEMRQVIKQHITHTAAKGNQVMANRIKATFSSLFKWALVNDRVTDNPAYALPHYEETEKTRHYTQGELRKLLPYLARCDMDQEKKDIIYLILCTGLRIGEVQGIGPEPRQDKREWWDQFDSDLSEGRLYLPKTKNGKEFLVALPKLGVEVLRRAQMRSQGRYRVFSTTPWGLRQALHRASEAVSVTKCSAHDLRRTCATICAQEGVDMNTISRILNHTVPGVRVTAKVYAQYDHEKEKRAALEVVSAKLTELGLQI